MGRILFELSGLFFLPFLAYAAFLIWQKKHPSAAREIFRQRAFVIQTLAGLALMALVLVVMGLLDESRRGGYSPAVFKDGRLIPGKVE